MMRVLVALLLAAAVFAEGEPVAFQKTAYSCAPLEFRVNLPEGWKAEHDNVGMVARGGGLGFRVSREPFLSSPKTFLESWSKVLSQSGLVAEVKKARAGRYAAFRAAYTFDSGDAGKNRPIELWRVHVPDSEMLYNFSFSVTEGYDAEALIEGVLKSFVYVGGTPNPGFQKKPHRIGRMVSFELPEGYAPQQVSRRGPMLGGDGTNKIWVKPLPGYKPSREAGRLTLYIFDHRRAYDVGGATIAGGDLNKITDSRWSLVKDSVEVTKKGRGKSARAGPYKARGYRAMGIDAGGASRVFRALGWKQSGVTIVITLWFDEREERLHKSLFKDLAKSVKEGS